MFICLCNGVTDADIRRASDEGARSFNEVKEQLSIGLNCGSCMEAAKQSFESHQLNTASLESELFFRVA